MNSYEQLPAVLTELFLPDQANLDFGIYRVIGQRQEEILAFLGNNLLPQVRTELAAFGGSEHQSLRAELAKVEQPVNAKVQAGPRFGSLTDSQKDACHEHHFRIHS